MSSLQKLAVRGALWTFVGYGSGQVLRLIGNLILTRLLVPEMFGLMALVQTFITGLNLFSDIGIRPSIIQNKRGDDPVFLNTAWTMQVMRGLLLWVGCFLIALPVSNFYGDSRLLWLVPIVGTTVAIDGFNSTSLALLSRKVAIAKLTVFEITIQSLALGVMTLWAFFRQTIWALVGGNLISSFCKLIWSHRLEPRMPHRFTWDKDAVHDLTTFGRWIFLSTAMTFLAQQSDRLILGRLLSLEMLGVYTIAFTFSFIPNSVIVAINSKVIFPVVSKRADLPRPELRAKILQKRWLLLVALAVGIALLGSFGDLVIVNLYDERYHAAAWMLAILALGNWPSAISLTINSSLLAIGKPIYGAIGYCLKFIYMLLAVPLAFSQLGVFGAILTIAFNDLPFYAAIGYGAWREQLTTTRQDLLATLLLLGLVVLLVGGRYWLGWGLPIDGLWQ
jgi:O-antigen/teichoic acid export membrane protein